MTRFDELIARLVQVEIEIQALQSESDDIRSKLKPAKKLSVHAVQAINGSKDQMIEKQKAAWTPERRRKQALLMRKRMKEKYSKG